MHFQMALNQPDTGEISVNLNDPKAVDITDGRLIKMVYRGAPIGSGGFFVENIGDDKAASGDRGGQWKRVSGRGGLAILDDGIIYPVADETSRTFTAVTMGSILLTLITEAKARGCFPSMRTEFSATLDSNGDPWTDTTTIPLQVGTSLLDVARQFADLGLEFKLTFDWTLGDYALYAYGSPVGTDKSGSVVVRIGQNTEQFGETRESSALKNAYLVSYQAGMTTTSDAASIAAYRRREAFFQAGNAPSSGSALVLANAELAARKDPVHSITVKLNDGANPPRFGTDYDIGDWIGVDYGGGLANPVYRIRGITLEWTGAKFASITLVLNSIQLEQELRTAIAMRKIANGSLGSSTSGVTPDAAAVVDAHDGDNSAHTNRPLSGDLAGTLGAPVVKKLNGVALDDPLTASDQQLLQYSLARSQIEFGGVPAHAGTHLSGQTDAIKLDDLAAPDDNTDLDASTTSHGLMKKFPGGTVNFLREDGNFASPSGAGLGDVTGPDSAVDGHLAVFDGTSGKIIKDGGAPGGGGDGWISANETWTYVDAVSFTVPGDMTEKYQKGDKICLTQTTVKYFSVLGVSYVSPNTTITVTGGTDFSLANAPISENYFSKIENPTGFPGYFNWLGPSGGNPRGFSSISHEIFRIRIIGDAVVGQFACDGTSNNNSLLWTLPVAPLGAFQGFFRGNNSGIMVSAWFQGGALGPLLIDAYTNLSGGDWTTTGTKGMTNGHEIPIVYFF